MRFYNRSGTSVKQFTFDRPDVPVSSTPEKNAVLKAADLDNPYSRYYGNPRTREDLMKNRNNF